MSLKEQKCKCSDDKPCKVEEDLMICKTELGQQVESLREEIAELKSSVSELLGLFKDTKGFTRTVGRIGNFMRWLALVGVAFGAVYAFFTKVKF